MPKNIGGSPDVSDKEPPDSLVPSFQLDNVFLSPHIGDYRLGVIKKKDQTSADSIVKVLRGHKLVHGPNKEVLGKRNLRLRFLVRMTREASSLKDLICRDKPKCDVRAENTFYL